MLSHKIEKLPIVQSDNSMIIALIHLKDIEKDINFERPNKDDSGRLYVGAAIGAKEEDIDRAKKLVNAGCDVLVLDIANGHSDIAVKAVERLK